MSIDTLLSFLKSILPSLEALAALTTTTLDDNVVAVVKAAIENPLVAEWLHMLVEERDAVSVATQPPAGFAAAVEASKIDWAKWIQAIPTILAIVKLFAKKG